jgi:hypothetical protein
LRGQKTSEGETYIYGRGNPLGTTLLRAVVTKGKHKGLAPKKENIALILLRISKTVTK